MQTFFPRKEDVVHNWHVIDAEGKSIGRVASVVANLLMGKHKPIYTPHVDTGDHVIIINAGKVNFTGKKLLWKVYRRHSSQPGGLKEIPAGKMMEKHPARPLELAIKGMLPKTKMGRAMYGKLKVYAGSDHPHQAQQPQPFQL